MQTGRIFRKGQSWFVGYNVKEDRGGTVKWVSRIKKIAPYSDEYRSAASVRHLAQDILGPLNSKQARPEPTQTVAEFVDLVYLPHCKANLRPSTYSGYCHLSKLVKSHLAATRIRDFGPVEGERLLTKFATEKRRANSQLKNMKGFMSGAFRYAVRTGVIRFNPMRETMLPRNGKPMETTHAYTIDNIHAMLKVLPEPSRTAVLVAALTGLRLSEIRGLRWEDFTGSELHVRRAVWASHVSETKTSASAATVPVLPILHKALEAHRKRSVGEFIFSGSTGRPLVLQNVTRRDILPALKVNKIDWHGWHSFRRGLATNLYALAIPDKVIQQILRHANVAVTMKHYVKTSDEASRVAMEKLGKVFGN